MVAEGNIDKPAQNVAAAPSVDPALHGQSGKKPTLML
jgi:hypothetical protein